MSANELSISIGSFFIAGILLLCIGCGEDEEQYRDFNKDTVRPGMTSIDAKKRLKQKADAEQLKKDSKKSKDGLGLPQLKETDFIKGAKRRDPFEPFVELLGKQEEVGQLIQREVKLKEYDITELKLIGIITKIGDPRAMVVVPDGTGFVLKRGDYVGRADFVQQGKRGESIQVNWRVARIHGSGKEEERGIYLVRDDPTTTKGVDITRFLPLHPNQ
ncbi:MAG: pilus assembly protein PilP [Proteobacteria bacterium]|nr:pilus assembly protein PilP [Pseudomonadota bacterium]